MLKRFQSSPPSAWRLIKSWIHYSQDKGQTRSGDHYIRSSAVLLGKTYDWSPLRHHKSLVLFCFFHMDTLNSCHFFLYLLWIFKKCYQSTCFSVFLLSFPFFPPFTVGLREAWGHALKLIKAGGIMSSRTSVLCGDLGSLLCGVNCREPS